MRSKTYLGIASCIAIFSFAGLLGFFFWSQRVVAQPTCANYEFGFSKSSFMGVANLIESTLINAGLSRTAGDRMESNWSSALISVSAHLYKSEDGGMVFICATQKRSLAWQLLATKLEQSLVGHVNFRETYLQRDPAVYGCQTDCVISASVPVNFTDLNQGELRFPK